MSSTREMAPGGILSLGHCSSLRTWEVSRSPIPISVIATRMAWLSPVGPSGVAFFLAVNCV